MARYVKDTTKLTVKFVQESENEVILEIPTTALELHDYFKPDFVTSVLKNTFGEDKLAKIGNVILLIDQRYNLVK
jgi:hypothetical protein